MKIAFVSGPYESLGLEYLSAVTKASGHETRLFIEPCLFQDDAVYLRGGRLRGWADLSDYVAGEIAKYRPDVVGMSVVSDYYGMYLNIAKKIKKIVNVPIVFGGVHPSAVPEKVLEQDAVDYVCVGEGEQAFLELVQALEKRASCETIKNIWQRGSSGLIKNELRPLIEDLDTLPYPDKGLYYRQDHFFQHTYTCMTSRGCFFDCAYCFNSFYRKMYAGRGDYFRRRSVGNVIGELTQEMCGRAYSSVRFADDIFNHDKEWLRSFFKAYQREINKPFDCQLWLDSVDEETAELIKRSGGYLVEIGIQSFSQEVRERVLNRLYNNAVVEKSIDILKKAGIRVLCENIYGLPEQGSEHIKASLKFYAEKKVMASFYGLRFYPKTRIVDIAVKKGLLTAENVDNIEQGADNNLFTYGGDSLTKDFIRIHRWLFLSCVFPQAIILPFFERIYNAPVRGGWFIRMEKLCVVFRCRPLSIALNRIITRIIFYLKYVLIKGAYVLARFFYRRKAGDGTDI